MKRKIALIIAVAADLVQIGLGPLFAPGFISPFNNVLDVMMAGTMIYLLGWNPVFVPCFIAEAIPMFNLVPTWTVAVLMSGKLKSAQGASSPTGRREEKGSPPAGNDQIIDV